MYFEAFLFIFLLLTFCFITAWFFKKRNIGHIIRSDSYSDFFLYLYDGNDFIKQVFSNLGSVLSLSLMISICVGCYYLIGALFLIIPFIVFGLSYLSICEIQKKLLIKYDKFHTNKILDDMFETKHRISRMLLFCLIVFQYTLYIAAEIFVLSKVLPVFWGENNILTTITVLIFCFICYLYVINFGYSGVVNTDMIQVLMALSCIIIIIMFERHNLELCIGNFCNNIHYGNVGWKYKFTTAISLVVIGVSYFVAFPDNFIRNIFTLKYHDMNSKKNYKLSIGVSMGLLTLLSFFVLVFMMGVMKDGYGLGFDVQHSVNNFPIMIKLWIGQFSNNGLIYSVLCVVCLVALTSIDTWVIGSMQTIDSILNHIPGFRYLVLLPFIILMAFYLGINIDGQHLFVLGVFTYPILFMETMAVYRLVAGNIKNIKTDTIVFVTILNEIVLLFVLLSSTNIENFIFISLLFSFLFEIALIMLATISASWISRRF